MLLCALHSSSIFTQFLHDAIPILTLHDALPIWQVATRDAFGEREDVGAQVPLLNAEAGARAAEAGDHLVHDDEHIVLDRKSTRLNSSHRTISYAVFCLKKKNAWPAIVTGTADQP